MQENTRRFILKGITTLPIVGGAMLAMQAILRYFKPTMVGGIEGMMAPPDEAGSALQAVAAVTELTKPWDVKDFIYVRKSVEYSSRKFQGAKIPGYVVRLPDEFVDPKDEKSKYVVVQRICPHLGCTFNFISDSSELAGGYNYKAPPPFHPHFACPCHLSVYDPTRPQPIVGSVAGKAFDKLPGKVVSGPAPRPPRTMAFDIKDGLIWITDTEGGGVG